MSSPPVGSTQSPSPALESETIDYDEVILTVQSKGRRPSLSADTLAQVAGAASASPKVNKHAQQIRRSRSASLAAASKAMRDHKKPLINVLQPESMDEAGYRSPMLSPLGTRPLSPTHEEPSGFHASPSDGQDESEDEGPPDVEDANSDVGLIVDSDSDDEDSDVDNGFHYDELMINLNKLHLETAPEAHAINRLLSSMCATQNTATIAAALSYLEELDMANEKSQIALLEYEGVDLLLQLLKIPEPRLQIAICEILADAGSNPLVQQRFAHLSAVELIADLLSNLGRCRSREERLQLMSAVARTLGAMCRNVAANRRAMRTSKGLRSLVRMLHTRVDGDPSSIDSEGVASVIENSANALWAACHSSRNRTLLRNGGGLVALCDVLVLKQPIPPKPLAAVLGALMQAAQDGESRCLIHQRGATQDMVAYLNSDDEGVRTIAAGVLFSMLRDADVRTLLRNQNGIEPLVQLLRTCKPGSAHLGHVTGALWQAAGDPVNAPELVRLNAVPNLVRLADSSKDSVLHRSVAALANIARVPEGAQAIRAAGGIPLLIRLLSSTDAELLIHVTDALWQCARDKQSAKVIGDMDALRLLWTHLKSPDIRVQANAAGAVIPLLDDPANVAVAGRSFVGGIEMLIALLASDSPAVLANACAALAKIATDMENLLVITEDGVVPLLAAAMTTENVDVQRSLCAAVAAVCRLPANRVAFGQLAVIPRIVEFLRSHDHTLKLNCVGAIAQLAKSASNAEELVLAEAVQPLVECLGSEDHELQDIAAVAVSYIRRHHIARCERIATLQHR